MIAVQKSFLGGMNLLVDDANLMDDEYGLAYNVSSRLGTLKPLKKCELLNNWRDFTDNNRAYIPRGIAFLGDYLIVIASGQAWYYKLNLANPREEILFKRVKGFQFSNFYADCYFQLVPASTSNLLRKLSNGSDATSDVLISPSTTINGTPQALVVQNGVEQPWIIYESTSGLAARRTQTYDDWTPTSREYVPVGKQMAYANGILFIASPDGKLLYHSVSGRPLDFVVAIDNNGNKVSDATTVAWAVGFDKITCLKTLNSGEVLVATADDCFTVTPNYEITIFGEPTFVQKSLFSTGVINERSIVDLLGDIAFLNSDGIRSFNAVLQNTTEGKNSIFSLQVEKLFSGDPQISDECCVGYFDDYALFAFRFYYGGPGILVYDMLSGQYSSVYRSTVVNGYIRQFATHKDAGRMFAITSSQVYEMFSSEDIEIPRVSTRTFTNELNIIEQRPTRVQLTFSSSVNEGALTVSVVSDGKRTDPISKNLTAKSLSIEYPVYYPASYLAAPTIDNMVFQLLHGLTGWKLGYYITWTSDAELTRLVHVSSDIGLEQSLKQQSYVS